MLTSRFRICECENHGAESVGQNEKYLATHTLIIQWQNKKGDSQIKGGE